MLSCQRHLFAIPQDVVYLDAAYMTPIPRSAVAAGERGVRVKAAPWDMTIASYYDEVERARELAASFIGAAADDIAVIPATSYGIAVAAAGMAFAVLWLLFAGAVIAGAGFGAGFSSMLRMLAPLAPNNQRAELFAGIFLVSYVAYGVPALIAGELIGVVGLLPTALGYAAAIALAAAVALVVQVGRARVLSSSPAPIVKA